MRKWSVTPWVLVVILAFVGFAWAGPPARGAITVGGTYVPEVVATFGVGGSTSTGLATGFVTAASNVTLLLAWIGWEPTMTSPPVVQWGSQTATCLDTPWMQTTTASGTAAAMRLKPCYLVSPMTGVSQRVWLNFSATTGCGAICGEILVGAFFSYTDLTTPLVVPITSYQNDTGVKSKSQYLNISGSATQMAVGGMVCDGWSADCKPYTISGAGAKALAGISSTIGPWYGNPGAPTFAESLGTFTSLATGMVRLTTDPVGASAVWAAASVLVNGAQVIGSSPWPAPTPGPSTPGFYDWIPPMVFILALLFMVIPCVVVALEIIRA